MLGHVVCVLYEGMCVKHSTEKNMQEQTRGINMTDFGKWGNGMMKCVWVAGLGKGTQDKNSISNMVTYI